MGPAGRLAAPPAKAIPGDLAALVAEYRPAVVAIDGPPGWGTARSRLVERRLAALGISIYATPADPGDHPFYGWMRVAFECFAAVAKTHPLYRRGESVAGHAIEVFPHGSAVVLAGALPPRSAGKAGWRREVLTRSGVEVTSLHTPDQVDAALCALTGSLALAGTFTPVGDPDEAVLVLPRAELPARYFRS